MPRRSLGAWTIATLVFLYAPIAVLVLFSFNTSRLNIVWEGFTTRWYGAMWSDVVLMKAAANSLLVASVTTLLSVALGTAGGWLLHRYRFPGARLWRALILTPMLVPEVVMGVSLLALFVFLRLELGFTSLILAHVTFCFPFVLMLVQSRLARLDPALEEAAMDLGATPAIAFRRVLLPQLRPAVVSGALLAFALSLDELIVSYFTASAASRTLPLEIFGRVRRGLDPSLNAISTCFLLASMMLVLGSEVLRRRSEPVAQGEKR
ncbi:MAG TPA: ABC transporter permease [Candidatus Binatia bacterium]|nr:ABC transporter permease [Candidatus Binatia bacterium]